MSDLSFNKNRFIKTNPATLSKPLPQNVNNFGRRKVEEIKEDMYLVHKQNKETNNQEKLNGLKKINSFKNWSNK